VRPLVLGAVRTLLRHETADGRDVAVAAALEAVQDPSADQARAFERLRGIGFSPGDESACAQPLHRRTILEAIVASFRATAGCAEDADAEWPYIRERLARLGAPRDLLDAPAGIRDEIVRHHLASAWLAVCH
jgi:hypothetical protein